MVKTGLGVLAVLLSIALGIGIKQRALVPREHNQQMLWHQGHNL